MIPELKAWLAEQEADCVDKVKKLIQEDAPKNKFAIVTGELRMIEDVRKKLDDLEKAAGNS